MNEYKLMYFDKVEFSNSIEISMEIRMAKFWKTMNESCVTSTEISREIIGIKTRNF